MPEVSRTKDTGHGQCFAGHDDVPAGSPKDFVTTYVTGASTVFLDNQPIIFVGSVGHTDCGHTTFAVSGSPSVFAENRAIHRVSDAGIINEGPGTYSSATGSPTTKNNL